MAAAAVSACTSAESGFTPPEQVEVAAVEVDSYGNDRTRSGVSRGLSISHCNRVGEARWQLKGTILIEGEWTFVMSVYTVPVVDPEIGPQDMEIDATFVQLIAEDGLGVFDTEVELQREPQSWLPPSAGSIHRCELGFSDTTMVRNVK